MASAAGPAAGRDTGQVGDDGFETRVDVDLPRLPEVRRGAGGVAGSEES